MAMRQQKDVRLKKCANSIDTSFHVKWSMERRNESPPQQYTAAEEQTITIDSLDQKSTLHL
eukprot:scaffold8021_cov79-Skeletonema_marinoi.AAC.3